MLVLALLPRRRRRRAIPASLKSSCATADAARRATPTSSVTTACRPAAARSPNAGRDGRGQGAGEVRRATAGCRTRRPDADLVPGADTRRRHRARRRHLDADVPAPPGGYPLIVLHARLLHAAARRAGRRPASTPRGERWHYNNAWFASRGYVVVNYTARGFVNGESNGDRGSTGETQLDSRRFEINDFQYLAGQVADDPFFNVNPQKVVVDRRLLRRRLLVDGAHRPDLEQPRRRRHEARRGGAEVRLDRPRLLARPDRQALPDARPACRPFDGIGLDDPIGIPKQIDRRGALRQRQDRHPAGQRAHHLPARRSTQAFACLQSTDPFETNPLCTTHDRQHAAVVHQRPLRLLPERLLHADRDRPAPTASPIFNAAHVHRPALHAGREPADGEPAPAASCRTTRSSSTSATTSTSSRTRRRSGATSAARTTTSAVRRLPGRRRERDADRPRAHRRDDAPEPLHRPLRAAAGQPEPAAAAVRRHRLAPDLPAERAARASPADEPGRHVHGAAASRRSPPARSQLDMTRQPDHGQQRLAEPARGERGPGRQLVVERRPLPGRDDASAAGPGVAVYDSDPLAQSLHDDRRDQRVDRLLGDDRAGPPAQLAPLRRVPRRHRGDGRPRRAAGRRAPSGTVTYQLHGNGWRFPAGHRVRIEIAQDDDPYLRASTRRLERDDHPRARFASRSASTPPTRGPIARDAAVRPAGRRVQRRARCPTASTARRSRSARATRRSSRRAGSPSARSTPTARPRTWSARSGSACRSATRPRRPDEADVTMTIEISDVRRRSDLADYTGDLLVNAEPADHGPLQRPAQNEPGTMTEYAFPVRSSCQATADPANGLGLLAHDDCRRGHAGRDQGGQAHDVAARPRERVRRRARTATPSTGAEQRLPDARAIFVP